MGTMTIAPMGVTWFNTQRMGTMTIAPMGITQWRDTMMPIAPMGVTQWMGTVTLRPWGSLASTPNGWAP